MRGLQDNFDCRAVEPVPTVADPVSLGELKRLAAGILDQLDDSVGAVETINPARSFFVPTKTTSTASAEHYKWGGPQETDCDGWHLVKTSNLSIIEELMPAGTSETRHSHVRARQFFYVLEGELTLEVEYHHFVLHADEGIEVSPGQQHQALNRSANAVRMIVTSQPPSHGDRIAA